MDAHKAILENFHTTLWGHHIKVPSKIASPFLNEKERRVICTINGELSFHCALMHSGDGNYFINFNKENRSKLKLKEGDELVYSLKIDTSKYGLPMPEEFGELLKIDDEADKYFHALSLGKQRNLLFIIGKPKTSHTRLNKALAVSEFLKANKGVLDFKLLNQFFKEFNRI